MAENSTQNDKPTPKKQSRIKAGWELAKSAWHAFKLDKEMAWIQFFGAVLVVVAFAILAALAALVGNFLFGDHGVIPESASWAQTVAIVIGLLIVALVIVFIQNIFQGAIIFGITQRFNGQDPSVSSSLAGSWHRWHPIALFSLMMASVGVVLGLLEEKLPAVGAIATRLVGAAWQIANFFALPIIVLSSEKIAPLSATRQSVDTIRKVWGEGIVMQTGISGIGFLVLLPILLIFGGGTYLAASANLTSSAVGIGAVGVVVLGVFTLVFSTLSAIAKAALYYYATHGKAPNLFDAQLLDQAAHPKNHTTT